MKKGLLSEKDKIIQKLVERLSPCLLEIWKVLLTKCQLTTLSFLQNVCLPRLEMGVLEELNRDKQK